MIELDPVRIRQPGQEISGVQTQFLKRLVEFSNVSGLEIELAYFPPDHSQYNPIERCRGLLENHWNGSLLATIDTALRTAATMTWRGASSLIDQLTATYERGVRLSAKLFQPISQRIQRTPTVRKWSLTIQPESS